VNKPLTYASYLAVDELLQLQRPRSEEHDEQLFIIIHQVYELWFKEILHELDYCMALLRNGDRPRAMHTLGRVRTIMKVLVAQLDILETMTPLEFLSFRERLEAASGFQSAQFRELEFILGSKRHSSVLHFPEGTEARERLQRRYEAPTLWDAFLAFLVEAGYDVPEEALGRAVTASVQPSPAVQQLLVRVYRTDAATSALCERLVDLDEGLQEWRYRHVKMVERTIGAKPGTGGSAGAGYLHTTLSRPAFPDLWAVRSEF
jgi:tryptophan 2,3-dioxygenase